MVEVDANTDLVHLTRSMQHDKAADPQVSPPPPPPSMDDFASAFSQGVAAASQQPVETTLSTSSIQVPVSSTESHPSADNFRQTRLFVTLGLVLLLIIVWIFQNRKHG